MRNLEIENARIIFRNFKGEAGQYNAKGDRNFCVILDKDTAEALCADGWNVKPLRSREEDEEPEYYMQVKVNFNGRPPKVVKVKRGKCIELDEDSVANLDDADIETCDLIINPYEWNVNGKSGIKAYLKAGYFTVAEDRFESKYYSPSDPMDELDEEVPF